MAKPIGFSFPKRKRLFTIWEVIAGKDALRFVVLRQGLQQSLSWISKKVITLLNGPLEVPLD